MSSKNSRDIYSEGAANYIAIASRLTEIAVLRGTEAGIESAIKHLKEERDQQRKGRQDRRLRNTRLLLKNYRSFRAYAENAVYKASQAKESAIDILDGLDDYTFDDSLYVESIKTSQQRTLIILQHIDQMLHYYRIDCEESGKPEEVRRYRIIKAYYIDEERKTIEEIMAEEHIERRTFYKDINIALKPLSALIFGIDSVKLY